MHLNTWTERVSDNRSSIMRGKTLCIMKHPSTNANDNEINANDNGIDASDNEISNNE